MTKWQMIDNRTAFALGNNATRAQHRRVCERDMRASKRWWHETNGQETTVHKRPYSPTNLGAKVSTDKPRCTHHGLVASRNVAVLRVLITVLFSKVYKRKVHKMIPRSHYFSAFHVSFSWTTSLSQTRTKNSTAWQENKLVHHKIWTREPTTHNYHWQSLPSQSKNNFGHQQTTTLQKQNIFGWVHLHVRNNTSRRATRASWTKVTLRPECHIWVGKADLPQTPAPKAPWVLFCKHAHGYTLCLWKQMLHRNHLAQPLLFSSGTEHFCDVLGEGTIVCQKRGRWCRKVLAESTRVWDAPFPPKSSTKTGCVLYMTLPESQAKVGCVFCDLHTGEYGR